MHIAVCHLTRMQPGYICVAGIDSEGGAHIRPVLQSRLPVSFTVRRGGAFDIAALTDLGTVGDVGRPPEVEDRSFNPAALRRLEDLDADQFWQLLVSSSHASLDAIFGPDLVQRGHGCTVDVGLGQASLGCLHTERAPRLEVQEAGRVRVLLPTSTGMVSLSVTDLRLYELDQRTPRLGAIWDVQKRLRSGVPAILSVGLTRPWRKPGDDRPRHWLQVNNLHLEDDPAWKEASL